MSQCLSDLEEQNFMTWFMCYVLRDTSRSNQILLSRILVIMQY